MECINIRSFMGKMRGCERCEDAGVTMAKLQGNDVLHMDPLMLRLLPRCVGYINVVRFCLVGNDFYL